MIISFSVFKEKILDGTKTQTIRRYSEFQYKRFCNAKKYQLYWGNPRNGGTLIKEVEPSEKPVIVKFWSGARAGYTEEELAGYEDVISLWTFPDEDGLNIRDVSKLDGFENPNEMIDWFYERYGEDLYAKKFMILRWKP